MLGRVASDAERLVYIPMSLGGRVGGRPEVPSSSFRETFAPPGGHDTVSDTPHGGHDTVSDTLKELELDVERLELVNEVDVGLHCLPLWHPLHLVPRLPLRLACPG